MPLALVLAVVSFHHRRRVNFVRGLLMYYFCSFLFTD
jgi:hypothetical protein